MFCDNISSLSFYLYITVSCGKELSNEGNPAMRSIWENTGVSGMVAAKLTGVAIYTTVCIGWLFH